MEKILYCRFSPDGKQLITAISQSEQSMSSVDHDPLVSLVDLTSLGSEFISMVFLLLKFYLMLFSLFFSFFQTFVSSQDTARNPAPAEPSISRSYADFMSYFSNPEINRYQPEIRLEPRNELIPDNERPVTLQVSDRQNLGMIKNFITSENVKIDNGLIIR